MRLLLLLLLVPCLARAAEVWPRLYSNSAAASSFLRNDWNKYQENYHPDYVLDDDPATAWVEGAEEDGVGQSLSIRLTPLPSARSVRLVIFNGYQKSPALLMANAAPRQLTVTVRNVAGGESARQQLTLERKMGPQSFDIPVKSGLSEVTFTIDSVHRGSKYRDTCISDVQVFVDSDVKYNASLESNKHEELLRWKRQRLATAKFYRTPPKDYLFASTHFKKGMTGYKTVSLRYGEPESASVPGAEVSARDDERPEERTLQKNGDFVSLEDAIRAEKLPAEVSARDAELLRELASRGPPGVSSEGTWYAFTRAAPRHLLPENFSVERHVEDVLEIARGSLAAAKASGSGSPASDDDEEADEERPDEFPNVLLLEGTTKGARTIYFAYRTISHSRVASTETLHVLASFDGKRLLRMVAMGRMNNDDEGTAEDWAQVLVPSYTQGKLSRMVLMTLRDTRGGEPSSSGVSLRGC
ncbi:NADase-type glycan-binding domain-containing protein [Melittangium boletus]|uniref:NADase-type glycan-binding domain-containing protein n=1 Tax=Melittangium boletus TaxID=83453 RepID=UPI003DA3107E